MLHRRRGLFGSGNLLVFSVDTKKEHSSSKFNSDFKPPAGSLSPRTALRRTIGSDHANDTESNRANSYVVPKPVKSAGAFNFPDLTRPGGLIILLRKTPTNYHSWCGRSVQDCVIECKDFRLPNYGIYDLMCVELEKQLGSGRPAEEGDLIRLKLRRISLIIFSFDQELGGSDRCGLLI